MPRLRLLFSLIFWNVLIISPVAAQTSYPDTTRWLGQWADEGDLTYTMKGMIVIQENGDASGWFDWTMIYSPYREHRNLVGNTGRELLEGKYHKLSGFLRLENVGLIQSVEIISGDKYILQLVNGGEKMLGKNFEPRNYKGSLYALRVPDAPPPTRIAEKPSPPPASKKEDLPVAKDPVLPPTATPPAPAPAVPAPELPTPVGRDPLPRADFTDRTILTKDELAVNQDQVRIEIWDKSIVDGDIISLEWNGAPVLQHFKVSEQRESRLLQLQPGENLLVMHAENLGRIPPNTAAIAVYQGDAVQVYILNSDMGKSEAIRILRD